MSDVAVAWAKAQECPTRASKPVLAFVATWANAAGEAWAAVPVLALELQVDQRSVQRQLAELRGAQLLIPTGKWEVYEGKRYPIWKLPLDQGYPNTAAKLRALRAAARDAARSAGSPLTLASGDEGDFPRTLASGENRSTDSTVTPRADSTVTQIGKGKGKGSSNELPGERDAFDACLEAYEERGRDRTHRGLARTAFRPVFRELGAERAVAVVKAWVAGDPDLKRGDYGAPAFETFLESERWRRYLRAAEPDQVLASRTPFVGPEDVLSAIVVAVGRVRADTLLDGAIWRDGDRTILTRTRTAAGLLRQDVPWRLQQSLSIRFEPAVAAPQEG